MPYPLSFHCDQLQARGLRISGGLICYGGFQNLPWGSLSPGSGGPLLIPLEWLRTLKSNAARYGPVPVVSSGIMTTTG